MISAEEITREEFDEIARKSNISLPIEQSTYWIKYQSHIEGRSQWRNHEGGGNLVFKNEDRVMAIGVFLEFETHGYRYLVCQHGPIWVGEYSLEDEENLARVLIGFVRKMDKSIVFARISLRDPIPESVPILSTVTYDSTVVVKLHKDPEQILAEMKPRGRRDVRKSERECKAECADETKMAYGDFSPYYPVMEETAKRDGFVPMPSKNYEEMLTILGYDHCRLFAAREDGEVKAWSIITLNSGLAVRYYAAMQTSAMRMHVTDKLLFTECCVLGKQGVDKYDLMGIGSDFSPTLKGLNEFKTKFSKDTEKVNPSRDIPIHKTFYSALKAAKKLKNKI